jgi:hybrid cluster-associated redox disulfide protein
MTKIMAQAAGPVVNWVWTAGLDIDRKEWPMNVTRAPEAIQADSVVQEIVEQHPQTIRVFARHGLGCVGCYISPYHTIADSAREYAVKLEPLLSDLNRAVT